MPKFPNGTGQAWQVLNATGLRQNEFSAGREPDVSDDVRFGWERGSRWWFDGIEYICRSNAENAAEWVLATDEAAGELARTAISLSDTVFATTAEAATKDFSSDVRQVLILENDASEYVRAAAEPTHLAKFQDATGQWWVRQVSHAVSALAMVRNQGADVDHHAGLQAILDFMRLSQNSGGQELDLCGLQWGVSAPLIVPSKVMLKNGFLKALPTVQADWGDDPVVLPRAGSSRVHLHRVDIDCNRIANGFTGRDANSTRVSFTSIINYTKYGMQYNNGGGCYWTNFIIYKFQGQFPERTRKSARNVGYGLDLAGGVDGRISCGACSGKIRTSAQTHHLTISQLHVWEATDVNTAFTGSSGIGVFSTNWEVDTLEDIRVKKNGSVLTLGTGFTASLASSGIPTITVAGLTTTDTVTIYNCLKDVTAFEIRGYACTFFGCYIDNGYVDIYNTDNQFSGIGLYLSDYMNLESHVRLWATSANQEIGNLRWDVRRASPNLAVFKLMAEDGASWVAGSQAVESLANVTFGREENVVFRGLAGSSVVQRIISCSSSNRSLTQYVNPASTAGHLVGSGSSGDDYIIMTNGTIRATFHDDGRITFPGEVNFSGRINNSSSTNVYWGTNGVPTIDGAGRIALPTSHTIASLPAANSVPRRMVYVSDGASNKKVVVSDGAIWRYMDGTPV